MLTPSAPTPNTRSELNSLIAQLTDPLNSQNTAAKVRAILKAIQNSAYNRADDVITAPDGGTILPADIVDALLAANAPSEPNPFLTAADLEDIPEDNIPVLDPARTDYPENFTTKLVLDGTTYYYATVAAGGPFPAPTTDAGTTDWRTELAPTPVTKLSQPISLRGAQLAQQFGQQFSTDTLVAGRKYPIDGGWNNGPTQTVYLEALTDRTFKEFGVAIINGVQTQVRVDVQAGTFTVEAGGGVSRADFSAAGGALTYNNTTGQFSLPAATAAQAGYLTAADYNSFAGKQAALGFTPENAANKNATNGYAGLVSGKVVVAQLPNATSSAKGIVQGGRNTTTIGGVLHVEAIDYRNETVVTADGATASATNGVAYVLAENTAGLALPNGAPVIGHTLAVRAAAGVSSAFVEPGTDGGTPYLIIGGDEGGTVLALPPGQHVVLKAEATGYAIVQDGRKGTDVYSALTYAASIALDFNNDSVRTLTLTGNLTLTSPTANKAVGKTKRVFLYNSTASAVTLTLPSAWVFYGAAAPTSLAAGKRAILSLECLGTAETDIHAAYTAQL